MKIAMIGQKGMPAHYGGVERIVEQLSIRLVQLGHEVFVYSRPYYTPTVKTSHEGVKIVSLPSLRTKHFDAISHTFFATVHALFSRYDIIHYHGVGPSLLSFLPRIFRPGVKVIVDFQCRDALHQKWGKFAQFFLRFGEWAALRFPHVTTVPTKTLQEYCQRVYGKNPVVVSNGMYLPQLKPASRIAQDFGLSSQDYLLVVSRLVRHKGVHFLIEAYKKLHTNKKLVIVGDGVFTDDYVRELKTAAQDFPNIIFTGWQNGDVLEELFSNAYLYIQPSQTEGLSLALLEAAAYNNCILTSDIPENREIADACGFIFQNTHIGDLVAKLEYLLENPNVVAVAGKRARKLVEEKYLWDDITRVVDGVYHRTMQLLSRS